MFKFVLVTMLALNARASIIGLPFPLTSSSVTIPEAQDDSVLRDADFFERSYTLTVTGGVGAGRLSVFLAADAQTGLYTSHSGERMSSSSMVSFGGVSVSSLGVQGRQGSSSASFSFDMPFIFGVPQHVHAFGASFVSYSPGFLREAAFLSPGTTITAATRIAVQGVSLDAEGFPIVPDAVVTLVENPEPATWGLCFVSLVIVLSHGRRRLSRDS